LAHAQLCLDRARALGTGLQETEDALFFRSERLFGKSFLAAR
jgi:hypothetical protein